MPDPACSIESVGSSGYDGRVPLTSDRLCMTKNVEFQLADNALDYILSAAEHAKTGNARDLKYAVLHLFAGVELILKASLQSHDWTLLFSDMSKATLTLLQAGDFRSVDFHTAWDRLDKHVGLSLDPADFSHLDGLRKLRNRVQHLQVTVDAAQVKSLLAHGGSFVVGFLKDQLPALETSHADVLSEIHEHLRDFKQFVAERLKAIQGDLSAAAIKIECPRCWQESLVIGDFEHPMCAFCGGEFAPEEMAEFSESAQVERCPECERDTVAVRFAGQDMVWFCCACGHEGTYRRCPRCNNLMSELEGPCASCMDEYLTKND